MFYASQLYPHRHTDGRKCCFIEQHCNKNGKTFPILAYELKLTGMEDRNNLTQIHLFFSSWGKSVIHSTSITGSSHSIV